MGREKGAEDDPLKKKDEIILRGSGSMLGKERGSRRHRM